GLDYYRTGADGRPAQHESFRAHIQLAKKHDKALVIHDRDAHEDVLAVLDDEGMPERTIMHCFSGDADFARECVSRGAWLSFAGTVTFKNASGLRAALAATPVDRILVETDAPFLTPEPHRGKPNASFLIPHTLRRIAEVKEMGVSELCDAVTANTNAAHGSFPDPRARHVRLGPLFSIRSGLGRSASSGSINRIGQRNRLTELGEECTGNHDVQDAQPSR